MQVTLKFLVECLNRGDDRDCVMDQAKFLNLSLELIQQRNDILAPIKKKQALLEVNHEIETESWLSNETIQNFANEIDETIQNFANELDSAVIDKQVDRISAGACDVLITYFENVLGADHFGEYFSDHNQLTLCETIRDFFSKTSYHLGGPMHNRQLGEVLFSTYNDNLSKQLKNDDLNDHNKVSAEDK